MAKSTWQALKSFLLKHKLNFESQLRKQKLQNELQDVYKFVVFEEIDVKKRWYGNSYGGFYVAPDLIDSNSIVYSIGIGKDISFDKAMMEKHACKIFAYDPTPDSINFINQLHLNPLFKFRTVGLAESSGQKEFFLPQIGVSGSLQHHSNLEKNKVVKVQVQTLQELMQQNGHTYIDLLKIDIEGSEYLVLEDIVSKQIPVQQILVEFHDRFVPGTPRSFKSIEMLREAGYQIFGVAKGFEEISLIRK